MRFPTGGDLLVEVLRAADVDTVFGVVSIHNLPLVQAVDAALRFVPVRHEAAAVNAADGYARARRGLGCALTSTGTGAGNAAGSLIEALTAGSPVLHVTGQIPTTYLGQGRGFIHETRDQSGMLAAVSAQTLIIDAAADAPATLQSAVDRALAAPTGPVSVEWPIDLQYASVDGELPARRPAAPVRPDDVTMKEAAALLASARRPVIWAGGGAADAGDVLQTLVDRLGAPLLTSNAGRGAVDEDHELCIGNYAAMPAVQAMLDDADVLLSVGTHFRSNETRSYKVRVPTTHIQIDVDTAAVGRVYPAKLALVGDAADVLHALSARIGQCGAEAGWRERAVATRALVRADQRADIGVQARFCDAIVDALPHTGVIARDVTIASSSWGNRLLPIHSPRSNIFARGGGIGQGLAMGIGAALGRPDTPVVVMAGDGGLAVHLGELLTLCQERPNLTLLVFNDRGYGVLRNLQDAQHAPRAGVDLHTPDFAGLARAIGLRYAAIVDPDDAGAVLADAVAAAGPTLVEIDLLAVEPMPHAFVPPVEVRS
ncbi:MAG: thiamine pyrophosphate-binding protein [Jatrophihabitans sp.]|nr:MAG: thiamine pyrophosphate-binding protein [Jatrophihabitans sp.]